MSTSQSTQDAIDHFGGSDPSMATRKSTGTRSYWACLLLKEAKQLAPIMIALLACSFVLHLLAKFGYQNEQNVMHSASLLMVPLLFAIGAGPMLVSQEKEQGTLNWIGSLPVGPRSIVMSKLIVCALGLILSWLLSTGLTCLLAPSFLSSAVVKNANIGHWIASTFALLSLGFALAWMLSTAISSLIALAVSTCVMFAVGIAALNMIFESETYDRPLEIFGLVLVSLVTALLAIVYAPRWFIAGAKAESIFSWKRWGIGGRRQLTEDRRPVFWTQSPASSLIWQSGRQNKLLWSGLILIVALSAVFLLWCRLNKPSEADFAMALLLPTGLVLSWVGASVFGSDAYRARINFLAQRGVAPGLIWWTRMILPLGITIVVLMLPVLIGVQTFPFTIGDTFPENTIPTSIIIVTFFIFALAQWFSQWTRSTLISFCVAPAVAVLALGYLIFVFRGLEAPLWILIPSIGVALLATRLMLCPWMDGRFDTRYWAGHGSLLLVALGIPFLPFLYTWLTYPDMPPEMKSTLVAEVEQYRQSPQPKAVDLKSNKRLSPTGDAKEESKDVIAEISDRLDAMEKELSATPGPINFPGNKLAIRTADLLSLRMDSMIGAEDPAEKDQAYKQRYQQVIGILDDIVRHLRLSERLQEQDYADYLERWLVSELSKPGRKEIFSEQQYARIIAGLADQQKRHQARRRAIVMAWDESQRQTRHQFKTDARKQPLAPRWLVVQRDAGVGAAKLLDRLESSVPIPLSYASELASLEIDFGPTRGILWHRPWETEAKKLSASLKSTPATVGGEDE